MVGDALQEPVKVVSGESPVERLGDGVVTLGESGEAVGDLVQVGEVVGGDDFSADDGEDDLDLVQPGGVNRQVDEPQVGPGALETADRGLTAVAAFFAALLSR